MTEKNDCERSKGANLEGQTTCPACHPHFYAIARERVRTWSSLLLVIVVVSIEPGSMMLTYAAPLVSNVVLHDGPVSDGADACAVEAAPVLPCSVLAAKDIVELDRTCRAPSKHLHARSKSADDVVRFSTRYWPTNFRVLAYGQICVAPRKFIY